MGLQIIRLIKAVFKAIGILLVAAVCALILYATFKVLLEHTLLVMGMVVVGWFSVLVYLLY